jgi:hypothetical protein
LGGVSNSENNNNDTTNPSSAIDSLTMLRHHMEHLGFEFIYQEDIPLIIREHQRKYQYIITLATGWRKIGRSEP